MPTEDNKSLSDEATYAGPAKHPPKQEQSVGDRSTLGGGDGSSVSGLGNFGDLADHDMEIVDLSSRYKIEETLGQGGMGEVLLATDTRLDRKVAIKRIRGDAGTSKAAVARFLTEAKSVAALNHPNVVQIHDVGRDKSGPFLIMEYVAGGSLLDRCKQGPMELEEAVELACQLCDGLGRAHDAGIIHRDIKPANILLTADGVPKLTDFGLAKADSRDHTMTMAGAVLGTLDFMPPEQRKDAALTDNRSDLWSLAATLYQMVTGEPPRVIDLDDVPQELRIALSRALKTKPDFRYQAVHEFRDALLGCVGSAAPGVANLMADSHAAEITIGSVPGRCLTCHSQNESSRSFCRGCGESLRVSCMSCKADIPIWENFCGECGGNQKELIAAQTAEEKRLAASMREPLITNSIGMEFKLIPAGTFEMGEKTTHTVTLTQPFHLGIYAVTQQQYTQVMRRNPSKFFGPQNPVESVSWEDAVEFCRKLSVLPAEQAAGRVYGLPTEAEWEYGCRAGSTTTYSFGDDEKLLAEYAWLINNSTLPKPGGFWSNLFTPSTKHHHAVGGKKPNFWGLYDMHGNVWEWCLDWHGNYPSGKVTDPTGPPQGTYRVRRGGSWYCPAEACRSAIRGRVPPSGRYADLGFRVTCVSSRQ